MRPPATDLPAIGRLFEIPGAFGSGEPYGSGHIHATFRVAYVESGRTTRYLHQRLNLDVFRDPLAVTANVERVLAHLRRKLAHLGPAASARRTLTAVPARDGRSWAVDGEGGFWRTWLFIEGTRSVDAVETPRQAQEAARTFGVFQRLLEDLPGPPLLETIPGFHDTPARFGAFGSTLAADPAGRAAASRAEIDFALARKELAGALERLRERGEIEEGIAHNDTKLNNVLFDDASGEGLCVIDLDTVMPGLTLCDFGDLVRSASSWSAEDEADPAGVRVDPALFEALARGWLEGRAGAHAPAGKEHLVLAGKVIALECGLRFLSDHLEGDRYFRVEREGQNLDRCRTQFALVRSLETQEAALARSVERLPEAGRSTSSGC